jgi:S1-C subfamily serine protease
VKNTFYQILGVDPRASAPDIQAAYTKRLAALQTGSAPQDVNSPTLLREAYETLSDTRRRVAYDASLMRQPSRTPTRGAEETSRNTHWGIWMLAGGVVVAFAVWWLHRPTPAQVVVPAPSPSIAESSPSPAPVVSNAVGADVESVESAPQAIDPPATAAPAAPETHAIVEAPVRSAENVFAEVSPSVARVNVMDASGRAVVLGSGVVIDKETVITACHVAEGGAKLEVKLGEVVLPANLQLADEALDLCRLAVPGLRAPAVAIGSVASLHPGQTVYAIGAPAGLELTISQGIVSALRKVDEGTVIQTSTPISPGSSGGGLFDISGHLVGITTFQHRYGQNLNFALPADWVSQMRARKAALNSVAHRTLSTGQAQANPQADLIVGQWLCRDWTSGLSGQYRFEADGNLGIVLSDGRSVALNYRVFGKALQLSDSKYGADLAIEELTERKMVLHGRDKSMACER